MVSEANSWTPKNISRRKFTERPAELAMGYHTVSEERVKKIERLKQTERKRVRRGRVKMPPKE